MKDFNTMFASRYSAVCSNDEEAGIGVAGATASSTVSLPEPGPAAATAAAANSASLAALERAQRRKSLKANRQTMKPMDILGSFFSERDPSKRSARSPTCKLKKSFKSINSN